MPRRAGHHTGRGLPHWPSIWARRLAAISLALALVSPAQASLNYGVYLKERYDPQNVDDQFETCVYCHTSPAGGIADIRQPFGVRLSQLGAAGGSDTQRLGQILDGIEQAVVDEDSDADGFDDLLELRAGSNPSDPTSRVHTARDGSLSEVLIDPTEGGCSVIPAFVARGDRHSLTHRSSGLAVLFAFAVCFCGRRRKRVRSSSHSAHE